ncbi:uncharacterized protein AC631_02303 [Debaryomyces fabryi]|uniref:Uncharacterized protein n=1 Tax=Debaryomyces fabryi TaxID=58627 RepID=A0A0V1Q0C9_9ASCO|nr:uncharacterized protein AC631_02303 [Debaryomyces fabryi]KSA01931.1 hypothetical protein AC631_02303 [Debaryomyces fabryi]
MTTLTNIKFITSIIHWISDFPNSPISADSVPVDIASPNVICKTLGILLNENDFSPQLELNEIPEVDIKQDASGSFIKISVEVSGKIQEIESALEKHFDNNHRKLKKIEVLRQIYKAINFYKLVIFQDICAISRFCELILRIGTYSSKLSTFGLTSIEFLSDQDKESIDEYFYGNDFREMETINTFDLESGNVTVELHLLMKEEGENKYVPLYNSSVSELSDTLRTIDNLRKTIRTPEGNYDDVTKKKNFVVQREVEFIDSIIWENQQYQKLIYSLLNL